MRVSARIYKTMDGIAPLGYEVADGLPSRDMARDPEVAAAAMAAYQKDGSGSLGMVPLTSAFMPCVDLGQPELEEILQKIEASIKNPEISITHRKQFEVLRAYSIRKSTRRTTDRSRDAPPSS
jgi:hypothetical protein